MTSLGDFGGWRPLVLADDPEAAVEGLAAIADGSDGVIAVSEKDLKADWPDYVVARARVGGAMAAIGGREDRAFMRLGEGRILGRPAIAGLVAGSLVFLIGECDAGAAYDVDLRRAA